MPFDRLFADHRKREGLSHAIDFETGNNGTEDNFRSNGCLLGGRAAFGQRRKVRRSNIPRQDSSANFGKLQKSLLQFTEGASTSARELPSSSTCYGLCKWHD